MDRLHYWSGPEERRGKNTIVKRFSLAGYLSLTD